MYEWQLNPRDVKDAEIVVGMASYQEADTIEYPTLQADQGLQKYYGDKSSAILNCDNHSPDGTVDVFMRTKTDTPKLYVTTPPETPGKGYNFENMFRKIFELNTKVLVCVDADLTSITPEWIKYFADPILEGYDYVTPVYARHKYDGTITNNICYPLIYGLFGKNIRQPIGGDFALSGDICGHMIRQPWHRTTEQYGIDIFMTMSAVTGGFKICSTGLGAKIHKPSAPKLGPMFVQVVRTAFSTILRNRHMWMDIKEVDAMPHFGLDHLDAPQELEINREAIEKKARYSFLESQAMLEQILSPDLYRELSVMFEVGGTIDIGKDQWITAVYDAIAAFHQSEDERKEIVEAMRGLYFGRSLTFMNKTWEMNSEEAEARIVVQAERFWEKRDYLIDKLED